MEHSAGDLRGPRCQPSILSARVLWAHLDMTKGTQKGGTARLTVAVLPDGANRSATFTHSDITRSVPRGVARLLRDVLLAVRPRLATRYSTHATHIHDCCSCCIRESRVTVWCTNHECERLYGSLSPAACKPDGVPTHAACSVIRALPPKMLAHSQPRE